MEKLPKLFTVGQIDGFIESTVNAVFNINAIQSFGGKLLFTEDKLYFFFDPDTPGLLLHGNWFITYDEVEGFEKGGLFGVKFFIKLKDGKKLQFSNATSSFRDKVISGIESHKK